MSLARIYLKRLETAVVITSSHFWIQNEPKKYKTRAYIQPTSTVKESFPIFFIFFCLMRMRVYEQELDRFAYFQKRARPYEHVGK